MKTDGAVRVALAGAGRWGTNYLRTLAEVRDCFLVGIAETDEERALALAEGQASPVFESLEELLEQARPTAVIVATPDSSHTTLARAALEAGCDVLVEKPMALTTADALALESLADSRGLILAVGQTSLYHPGYHQTRDALAHRTIGRPLRARNVRTSRGIKGADLLWDLAPHSVAVAIGLFGEPEQATAERHGNVVTLRIDFPGIAYEACLEWSPRPVERQLTIEGTSGTLQYDETVLPAGALPPLTMLCRDFIDACRSRQRPDADARLGVRVVACIERAAAELGSRRTQVPAPAGSGARH